MSHKNLTHVFPYHKCKGYAMRIMQNAQHLDWRPETFAQKGRRFLSMNNPNVGKTHQLQPIDFLSGAVKELPPPAMPTHLSRSPAVLQVCRLLVSVSMALPLRRDRPHPPAGGEEFNHQRRLSPLSCVALRGVALQSGQAGVTPWELHKSLWRESAETMYHQRGILALEAVLQV